ncbi:MAG: hypothetical protein ACFCBW_14885 [Candidatus Competibacterales bacterium]
MIARVSQGVVREVKSLSAEVATTATQLTLPWMCQLTYRWAEVEERRALAVGTALDRRQWRDAERIGVQYPERVRLLPVTRIPTPTHPALKLVSRALGMSAKDAIGLSLGYGIFIRDSHWYSRAVVIHELVHTAQCERLGGLKAFLADYLAELTRYGYNAMPLEREARRFERTLVVSSTGVRP